MRGALGPPGYGGGGSLDILAADLGSQTVSDTLDVIAALQVEFTAFSGRNGAEPCCS